MVHSAQTMDGKLKIGLGDGTPQVGKIAVQDIDPDGKFITTRSLMPFAVSHCYDNRWLVNESRSAWHRVTEVSDGKVLLKESADLKSEFTDSDGDGHVTAYLYDAAPGQEFTIPALCWIGKDASGKWIMQSNIGGAASLPDGTHLGPE